MTPQNDNENFIKNTIEASIRVGLIILMVYWCYDIASPFIGPILWGIIIAIGTYPTFLWLKGKTGLSQGWTATLFSLLMLAILITPTIFLSEALLGNAKGLSEDLKDGTLSIPSPPENVASWPLIGEKLNEAWSDASENPKEVLGNYESQIRAIANWFIKAAANVGLSILLFVFSIIIAGVFLAKAQGARQAAVNVLTRLVGEKGEAFTQLSYQTVTSVVRGILGIAIMQTLLAGIGFLAMGIPGAGILAVVCLVLAIVQIDILIILIPLSIYAFSTAGTGAAIAFLIWNIGVGLMNNVLKPILLGRGVEAPMAVIFIGAIGGMIAHGIIGLFVGAVVFVLGYTLFIEWLNEEKLKSESAQQTEIS
jgi:predicted PurR-regulated permease PerM